MKKKSFLDKIDFEFNKIVLANLVLNMLFLVFGLIIYMNPYVTMKTVGVIIGIYLLVFSIFYLYEFLMRKDIPIFNYKLILGIFSFIISIFVIFNPFKLIKFLTIAMGSYLIILALCKLLETINFKKLHYDGFIIMLVTSILLLIFGVILTINPMIALDLVEVTGIFIILSCILEIANLFMIYTKAKDIKKLFKKVK